MQTDIQGRVRNVSLPVSKPLLPLYEAIVNSIQAIEDLGETRNGRIDIREGKARTSNGRNVPVSKGIPFYCYLICDIVPHLEQQAHDFELDKTPDGQGFFGFKKHYNAYFEVISYSKMVSDAKKRNAVLFNRLGLPSR